MSPLSGEWLSARTQFVELKACLDGMILSAWHNHTWFCHVWFFCLDGITMSCVISFNSEENWLGTLSYLIMLYICSIAIANACV